MTRDDAIEAMAKTVRREFIDSIVDKANPHWGTQKPDYLKQACKSAGYPNPDEAAEFFARAASVAALSALESLGIALVPVEPTLEMKLAGLTPTDYHNTVFTEDVYAAMLSASPLRKTDGGEE